MTQKRAKELLRQNRALQDEQREVELDIKVENVVYFKIFNNTTGNATRAGSHRGPIGAKGKLAPRHCQVLITLFRILITHFLSQSQSAKMREKMDHDARKKLERSVKESENALKTRDEKLERLRVSEISFLALCF